MRKIWLVILSTSFLFLFGGIAFASSTPKNWTFLIYLNGNNNLDDYGYENIKQMEKIGSNDQVNIVVQWASLSAGKTVRMLIQKNTNSTDGVISPVIQDLGNADMGDVSTLDDFIRWGVTNYPAEHYFINVWNHGSGWHSLKGRRLNSFRSAFDISWDDNTGHFISTEQLGQSMTRAAQVMGHKVDILGSDACLMAMAEVVGEMTDSVSVFVGSQEVEPARGWPYDTFLKHWEETEHATAEQVVKYLVKDYVHSYGDNDGVTLSAFDLGKTAILDQAVSDLGAGLRQLNAADREKVFESAQGVQRFANDDYADLLDFTKKLAALDLKSLDAKLLKNVYEAAAQLIIANEDSPSYADATGLSIWLPMDNWTYKLNKERYSGLRFVSATHWGETLDWFMQAADNNGNNNTVKM